MNQPRMTAEEAAGIISSWCFQDTAERGSREQRLLEEKRELRLERQQLEREKQEFSRTKAFEERRLEEERRLFDIKWKMLEDEWRKLAEEREQVEKKRAFYAKVENFEMTERSARKDASASVFFRGVENPSSLRKRYKDLIKIFHPDNAAGDKDVIQKINEEYESLKASMAK